MRNHLIRKLWSFTKKPKAIPSFLRYITSGSFLRTSDLRNSSTIADIRTKIETMRALAADSQIKTALSYYATDSTTTNNAGQIIWATSDIKELGDIINALFKKWNLNLYVRDHILELATIGNLYIPTTEMYRDLSSSNIKHGVVLDNNTIPDNDFDIVPSYQIPPEDIVHIWEQGIPKGYIYQPDENVQDYITYPETAVIHFSLGGLLGKYTIDSLDSKTGNTITFDVQFADPLLDGAVSPTTTLNLLEDATLLAALIRVVKFVNVDCSGAEEEEIQDILQQMKDTIEQQLSLNTATGDVESFLNPQSPRNLIYLPKVNGQDAVSIIDLNMAENSEASNELLEYYQNKKLSVLGIPKEALNFSSAEGLGAAGTVMSQRSALYANILERLMTAYKNGWTQALNFYFKEHNMSGYVDNFELHMNPIITTQSTIQFEKRDSALSQATTLLQLMKDAGIKNSKFYTNAFTEILTEVFPQMGAEATNWQIDVTGETGGDSGDF